MRIALNGKQQSIVTFEEWKAVVEILLIWTVYVLSKKNNCYSDLGNSCYVEIKFWCY